MDGRAGPRFAGKVALIVGGTSGIGRATALAFAREGASVVVAGRRDAEGAETRRRVEQAGGRGLWVRTDVTVETQVRCLMDRAVDAFGRIDCAFNNAGFLGAIARVDGQRILKEMIAGPVPR